MSIGLERNQDEYEKKSDLVRTTYFFWLVSTKF